MDIYIIVTNNFLWSVNIDYIEYIFSAIVAIGLISFSAIALVSGILKEKFYGYKLNELLLFKSLKTKISLYGYIKLSFIAIVIATFLIAVYYNKHYFVNALVSILIVLAFLTGHIACSIFDIMVRRKQFLRC